MNNAALGRHYFLPFYSWLSNPPLRLTVIYILACILFTVVSPHCYFPQCHALFAINFVVRLTSAISLFVCVVQIAVSGMLLTIHGALLGKRKSSADGISGNRYLRSGSVRYREGRKVWSGYSGSPMHVIGCAAIPALDDGQWSSAAVWERELGTVYGDDIPQSAGRVGNIWGKCYRGVTLSLPPRAR